MNFPRPKKLRSWILGFALGFSLLGAEPASAKESFHTVGAGQRLGSIAKRYGVSIEALCKINGIERSAKIQPGLRLVIPDPKTPESELTISPNSAAAKAQAKAEAKAEKERLEKAKVEKTKGDGPPGKGATTEKPKKKTPPREPQLHVVEKGQTLSGLAARHGTTVTAICAASGIDRSANLRFGQRILIPHRTDEDGEYARKLRLAGEYELNPPRLQTVASSKAGSWKKYSYQPKKRGRVSLYHYGRKWEGYVISAKGTILPGSQKNINWVLGVHSSGPAIDQRLLLLLSHVSDHFGGRTIRIVSGYRTTSWVAASKHKEGRAVDFSIPGVPNEVLRDYLRTLRHVGVGYYPNSSFVHLDVRGYNAYWIDYAGPGERPRHTKQRPKNPERPAPHEHDHADEGDDEAESAERHEPDEHAEEAKDADARPDELPEDVKELIPSPVVEPVRKPSSEETLPKPKAPPESENKAEGGASGAS